MRTENFKCEECPAVKQATNHWWLIYITSMGDPQAIGSAALVLAPWDESRARGEGMKHFCGCGCAVKYISRYMEGKL